MNLGGRCWKRPETIHERYLFHHRLNLVCIVQEWREAGEASDYVRGKPKQYASCLKRCNALFLFLGIGAEERCIFFSVLLLFNGGVKVSELKNRN
jgi:hypothetical protein